MWGGWNKGKNLINWKERIESRTDGKFELVDKALTDNGESKLLIRCVCCGTERSISASSIRGTNKIRCVVCDMRKTKNRHEFEKEQKEVLREVEKNHKKEQIAFKFCSRCGLQIVSGTKRYCDACVIKTPPNPKLTKEQWSKAKAKREARLKTTKRDADATLPNLFRKYNGICYLCGKPCDFKDGKWCDGVFKVGKNYPSREHIVPLSKGGEDTWDNLRLAHVSCNSKKGNRAASNIPLGIFDF